MSDIPEFVTWESENRLLETEEASQEAQRQRESSVLNGMVDSSNYEESDESDSDYSKSIEGDLRDLSREQLLREAEAGRGNNIREESVELDTVEVRQIISASDREWSADGGYDSKREDIAPASTGRSRTLHNRKPGERIIERTPTPQPIEDTQEEDPDFIAPPSSQPRPRSEDEDMAMEEEQAGGVELPELPRDVEIEDIVEEFDVGDNMEDLAWTLAQAPPEELENLRRVSIGLLPVELGSSRTRVELGMDKRQRKLPQGQPPQAIVNANAEAQTHEVRMFVEQHPLLAKADDSDFEQHLSAFEKEVFQFAKSLGMKSARAKKEMGKSKALFLRKAGEKKIGGSVVDGSGEEQAVAACHQLSRDIVLDQVDSGTFGKTPLLRRAVDVYPSYNSTQSSLSNSKMGSLKLADRPASQQEMVLKKRQKKADKKAAEGDQKRKRTNDDVIDTASKRAFTISSAQETLPNSVLLSEQGGNLDALTSSAPTQPPPNTINGVPRASSAVPSNSESTSVYEGRPTHMSKRQWKKYKKAQKHSVQSLQQSSNFHEDNRAATQLASVSHVVDLDLVITTLQHEEAENTEPEPSAVHTVVEQKARKKRATPKKRNKNRLSTKTDLASTNENDKLPMAKGQRTMDSPGSQQPHQKNSQASRRMLPPDTIHTTSLDPATNSLSSSTHEAMVGNSNSVSANILKPKLPRRDRGRRKLSPHEGSVQVLSTQDLLTGDDILDDTNISRSQDPIDTKSALHAEHNSLNATQTDSPLWSSKVSPSGAQVVIDPSKTWLAVDKEPEIFLNDEESEGSEYVSAASVKVLSRKRNLSGHSVTSSQPAKPARKKRCEPKEEALHTPLGRKRHKSVVIAEVAHDSTVGFLNGNASLASETSRKFSLNQSSTNPSSGSDLRSSSEPRSLRASSKLRDSKGKSLNSQRRTTRSPKNEVSDGNELLSTQIESAHLEHTSKQNLRRSEMYEEVPVEGIASAANLSQISERVLDTTTAESKSRGKTKKSGKQTKVRSKFFSPESASGKTSDASRRRSKRHSEGVVDLACEEAVKDDSGLFYALREGLQHTTASTRASRESGESPTSGRHDVPDEDSENGSQAHSANSGLYTERAGPQGNLLGPRQNSSNKLATLRNTSRRKCQSTDEASKALLCKADIDKAEATNALPLSTPPSDINVAAAATFLVDKDLSVDNEVFVIEPATKKRKAPSKSPFFTTPTTSPTKSSMTLKSPRTPRTPGGTTSCIPFPKLSAPEFGLIQERLAHQPFRLLIAVTFLIKTRGKEAIPVFYQLMEQYPTAEALAAADKEDIVRIIHRLGLQNQRALTYQTYAKMWTRAPPEKGKRYAVRGYPNKDSGKGVKSSEVLSDSDERVAWEIGHMTQGAYALDSWRIFCRDILRGVAEGWNGEGAKDGFQPEWMRVVPEDKELRAYLRWMWLKEGFEWDPFTGEKEVASQELTRAAMDGRIAWDEKGGMRILEE